MIKKDIDHTRKW